MVYIRQDTHQLPIGNDRRVMWINDYSAVSSGAKEDGSSSTGSEAWWNDMASFEIVDGVAARLESLANSGAASVTAARALLLPAVPSATERSALVLGSLSGEVWSSRFLQRGLRKQQAAEWPASELLWKRVDLAPASIRAVAQGGAPDYLAEVAATIRVPVQSSTAKYYAGVMVVFRWEQPYLAEWLEYHILLGVEHFWMIENDCENANETARFLQGYVDAGLVTLIRSYSCATSFQADAYNDVAGQLRRNNTVEW